MAERTYRESPFRGPSRGDRSKNSGSFWCERMAIWKARRRCEVDSLNNFITQPLVHCPRSAYIPTILTSRFLIALVMARLGP